MHTHTANGFETFLFLPYYRFLFSTFFRYVFLIIILVLFFHRFAMGKNLIRKTKRSAHISSICNVKLHNHIVKLPKVRFVEHLSSFSFFFFSFWLLLNIFSSVRSSFIHPLVFRCTPTERRIIANE